MWTAFVWVQPINQNKIIEIIPYFFQELNQRIRGRVMTLGATTTLWGENTDFLLQTIASRELVLIHYCSLFSFRWHQLKAINSVNFFKFCNCCNSFKSKNKASFLMFTTWDVAKFASVLLWSYIRFETQTLKYSFSLHITRFRQNKEKNSKRLERGFSRPPRIFRPYQNDQKPRFS